MKNNELAIVHDDYDGLISYLIYKKFVDKNITLEGVYKNCNILITKNEFNFDKISEYVGIDIDIELFKSIGHHLQYQDLVNKEVCLNPNVEFGNDGVKDIQDKCPFSTALLLVLKYPKAEEWFKKALAKEDVKTIATVLYADNFYPYIWQRFLPNVSRWFKKYDKYDIFLKLIRLQKSIRDEIENEMINIQNKLSDCFTSNKQGKYSQKFQKDKLQVALDVLKSDRLFVEGDDYFDLKHTIYFWFYEEEITDELISNLKSEKLNNGLISHAVTSKKVINYTLRKRKG